MCDCGGCGVGCIICFFFFFTTPSCILRLPTIHLYLLRKQMRATERRQRGRCLAGERAVRVCAQDVILCVTVPLMCHFATSMCLKCFQGGSGLGSYTKPSLPALCS